MDCRPLWRRNGQIFETENRRWVVFGLNYSSHSPSAGSCSYPRAERHGEFYPGLPSSATVACRRASKQLRPANCAQKTLLCAGVVIHSLQTAKSWPCVLQSELNLVDAKSSG